MINNPLKLALTNENMVHIDHEQQYNHKPFAKIINSRLHLAYNTIPCEFMLSRLEMPNVLRMVPSTTEQTKNDLITLIRRPALRQIIFAITSDNDKTNSMVLVMALEMTDITIVVDNAKNNMSRVPKIVEIEELFKECDQLNLISKMVYIPWAVEATHQLPPDKALAMLYGYEHRPFDLSAYLSLLCPYEHLLNPTRFMFACETATKIGRK